jgi:hypothetical protein
MWPKWCMWRWLWVLRWIGPRSQQAPDHSKNQIYITKFCGQSKLGQMPLIVHLELLDLNNIRRCPLPLMYLLMPTHYRKIVFVATCLLQLKNVRYN